MLYWVSSFHKSMNPMVTLFQDLSETFEAAPIMGPPAHWNLVTETEILLKLDDYIQPGLYEDEFMALLRCMVRCSGCSIVMAQRIFERHMCHQRYRAFLEPRQCKKAKRGL